MKDDTILALGGFLNENLSLQTCDNSLSNTVEWLSTHEHDGLESHLSWLEEQGVSCDCDVVLKLFIPIRDRSLNQTEPIPNSE